MTAFFKSPLVLGLVSGLTAASAWACPDCGCKAPAAAAASPHVHPHSQAGAALAETCPVASRPFSSLTAPEADRKAILSMAGEYHVSFRFEETVGLVSGYALTEPYLSEATEFVEVVEDTGGRIVLQHVLVMKPEAGGDDDAPRVVKHWRQDWTYQDTELVEYRGSRVFAHVEVDPSEAAGRWSQAVYQVDDSPRYEALGRWTHDHGRSAWESDETWRPLPRREYTKRSDYQVMVAVNRHVLTPTGWVHEQDNRKLVLNESGAPAGVLAHETGLNTYTRVVDVDFSAGRSYWRDTQAYWHDVRSLWADVLDDQPATVVATEVNEKPLYAQLFAVARSVRSDGVYRPEHRAEAEAVIRAALATP